MRRGQKSCRRGAGESGSDGRGRGCDRTTRRNDCDGQDLISARGSRGGGNQRAQSSRRNKRRNVYSRAHRHRTAAQTQNRDPRQP